MKYKDIMNYKKHMVALFTAASCLVSAPALSLNLLPVPNVNKSFIEAGRSTAQYGTTSIFGAQQQSFFSTGFNGAFYVYEDPGDGFDGLSRDELLNDYTANEYQFVGSNGEYNFMNFGVKVAATEKWVAGLSNRPVIGESNLFVFIVGKDANGNWEKCPTINGNVDCANAPGNFHRIDLDPIFDGRQGFMLDIELTDSLLIVSDHTNGVYVVYEYDETADVWTINATSEGTAFSSISVSKNNIIAQGGFYSTNSTTGAVTFIEIVTTSHYSSSGSSSKLIFPPLGVTEFGSLVAISDDGSDLAITGKTISGDDVLVFYSDENGTWIPNSRFEYDADSVLSVQFDNSASLGQAIVSLRSNDTLSYLSYVNYYVEEPGTTSATSAIITTTQSWELIGGQALQEVLDHVNDIDYNNGDSDYYFDSNGFNESLQTNEQEFFSIDEVGFSNGTFIQGWRCFDQRSVIDDEIETCSGGAVVSRFIDSLKPEINGEETLVFSNFNQTDGAESSESFWSSAGEASWRRNSGGTPSGSTGPTIGADGSSYYYYIETSRGQGMFESGDVTTLESGWFNPENASLSFDYHAFGTNIGELNLEVYFANAWSEFGFRSDGLFDNQSQDWESAEVNLDIFTFFDAPVKVRFKYIAAGGFRGDIALDNIEISN